MLNHTDRARAYEPSDTIVDTEGTTNQLPGSRRRWTQGEINMIDHLYRSMWDNEDATINKLADAVEVLMAAAPRRPGSWHPEPPTEEAIEAARVMLSDPKSKIMSVFLGALHDGLTAGFSAGQREGFRLGAVTMSRLNGATTNNPVPLPALKGLTTADALTMLVASMGDDAALDRLIGYLVVGKAPEFIPSPAFQEGGEE